jgi:type IV pilus assembly protein PilC
MVYPSVVIFVAISVTIGMLTFIVPVFAKMFGNFGAELPAPTQVVLGVSNFLKSNFLLLTGGLIAGIAGFVWWKKTPAGALIVDQAMLKIPVLGNLVRKSSVARFTRTLSTLLASGVSILDALEITAKTAGNLVVSKAINRSVLAIAEGDTITGPLKSSGVFPPMVIQMIGVGEKTGGLDEMLNKIADFYDEEVDEAVTALTSVIEPIIIVFMGIVIGAIMIAMYLPMFDIIGKF